MQDVCDTWVEKTKEAENIKYPVWVGEWSLATDMCAHWLGGLNDGGDIDQDAC
jgi:hypothetical protein